MSSEARIPVPPHFGSHYKRKTLPLFEYVKSNITTHPGAVPATVKSFI